MLCSAVGCHHEHPASSTRGPGMHANLTAMPYTLGRLPRFLLLCDCCSLVVCFYIRLKVRFYFSSSGVERALQIACARRSLAKVIRIIASIFNTACMPRAAGIACPARASMDMSALRLDIMHTEVLASYIRQCRINPMLYLASNNQRAVLYWFGLRTACTASCTVSTQH